jgi:hypothetical protein
MSGLPTRKRHKVDFMQRLLKMVLSVVSLLLISTFGVSACSLAREYFYQITALRGRVVGVQTHRLFCPRWLRQSLVRKHVKLVLYEYRQPWDEMLIIKTVETNYHGRFDFGSLKFGHYTLRVDGDLFNIEIKKLPRQTQSVTIDVSRIYADCTRGHEFLVKME